MGVHFSALAAKPFACAALFLAAAIGPAPAQVGTAGAAPTAAGSAAPSLAFAVWGDWKASVFGDIGGTDKLTAENFEIAERGGGEVFLRSSNDRGKIASTSEGIAYYYKEIPEDADFEISATVRIGSFAKNNQVSCGIMLRDRVHQNQFLKTDLGSYLAVGPVSAADAVPQFAFRRTAEGLVKSGPILKSPPPGPGVAYRLSLKKSGDSYTLALGDEEAQILTAFAPFSGGTRYLGLFTSRNTAATFSDIELQVGLRSPSDLRLDGSGMKTRYRLGEAFDPAGLRVSALYEDGSAEELASGDYAIFGFNSSTAGDYNLMISYRGVMKLLPYHVLPLSCSSLSILFHPLKTEYYPGDRLDPSGLRVLASYDEGYRVAEIGADLYELLVGAGSAEGLVLDEPGKVVARVASRETAGVEASFELEVKDARIRGLEIGRPPEKSRYFVGDRLDLAGMTVYADYDDGSRIRLTADEYRVSGFDSSSPGERRLEIEHKGKRAFLALPVLRRSPERLRATALPRTSYEVGGGFDPRGLELALAYDDGSTEPIAAAACSVDASAVDFSQPGLYRVRITSPGVSVPPLELPVAVRPAENRSWTAVRFGQSSSDSRNWVEELEGGTVRLVALEGGGKVSTDHDGLTFYYTVLDSELDNFEISADIRVLAYAKDPHDGQESFGIMARDTLGLPGESRIAASNFAAVGGFSGGTRNANGTQLFARTGVLTQEGAGSLGISKVMLEYGRPGPETSHPAKSYRLGLAKVNGAFRGRVNDGPWEIIREGALLGVQDRRLYLGFFAARLATIEVSGVRLVVTAAAADAEPEAVPPEKLSPRLDILSVEASGDRDYALVLSSNVSGALTVKRGGEILFRDREIAAGEEITVPSILEQGGRTAFTAALLPDDRQYLWSYSTLIKSVGVEMRRYRDGGDIAVSPAGTPEGSGSPESPLDLDSALAYVASGQTVVLADGVYERYRSLVIHRRNSGKSGAPKRVIAEVGARPLLDFSRRTEGVVLGGDWWEFRGLDVAYTAPNAKGFAVGGNHNRIEACRFYGNGDTGLQISRTDLLQTDKATWPSHNLVLGCESFDNRDPSENNADGFAAKLTSGEGNVFRSCVSHHNIDDGWDLYTKAGSGAIGAVLIEDCVSYANGRTREGVPGKGDKNGFKLGGEGIPVPHIVRRSFAHANGAAGFTSNSNPAVSIEESYALDNGGANFAFSVYAGTEPAFRASSLYSYKVGGGGADLRPPDASWPGCYLFDGAFSRDSSGKVLVRAAFMELLGRAGFDPASLESPK